MIFKYKRISNTSLSLTAEKKDIELFAEITHKKFEAKLYTTARNLKVPVYMSDSLITQSKLNDVDDWVNERVDTFIWGKIDTTDGHDSAYCINYRRSLDTLAQTEIRLIWGFNNTCGINLIAIAPYL